MASHPQPFIMIAKSADRLLCDIRLVTSPLQTPLSVLQIIKVSGTEEFSVFPIPTMSNFLSPTIS
jgi:hypothetical protein